MGTLRYVRRERSDSIGRWFPHVGFLRGVACLDVIAGYAPQKARKRPRTNDQNATFLPRARVRGSRSLEVGETARVQGSLRSRTVRT